MKNSEFKNKNVLITGASKGLGKTIALEFEKLGANLILIARSKDLLESIINNFDNKKNHLFYDLDLFDPLQRDNVLKDIEKKYSNIDIIIHCLGGSFGINDPYEDWLNFKKCLEGNLGVALDINKKFIPAMKHNKSGNIVHIGSVVGQQATASVPYVTSKAALAGYIRTMGNHLANFNIKLSGIIPGAFIADDNAMYRFRHFKPEDYKKFLQTLPLQRMPEAKEYLPFIKILCGQNSQVFSGSLVCMDTGQGTSINQVF